MKTTTEMVPLRVTYISEAAGGGVRHHLRYVIPELLQKNVQVHLIASLERAEPGYADDLRYLSDLGCQVNIVPMAHSLHPVQDTAAILRIRRLLREQSPHIVHTHAEKAGLLGRLAAYPQKRVTKCAVIHSPHAFLFQRFQSGPIKFCLTSVEQALSRITDRYILVSESEAVAARCVGGLPPVKLEVVENGIPGTITERLQTRAAARQKFGIADGEFAVGLPGRLAFQKGHDILMQALCKVPCLRQNPIRFHICGSGPLENRLRQQATKHQLEQQIFFHGFIPDLGRLLPAFDLAVLASRYEALPYIMLEAMAAGVPLLVSDIPSHFPRHEMRQFLAAAPVDKPDAWGTSIIELMQTPERRRRMSDHMRHFVLEHFPLDRQITQLLECYTRLTTLNG